MSTPDDFTTTPSHANAPTSVHPGVPAQADYSGTGGYPAPSPMILPQLAAPSRRMSPAAIVVIVVAAILTTVVVVLILAAIAIPVFLNQRAKAQAVTLGRPASIAGLPIVLGEPDNAKLEAAIVQMRADARVREALGLIYADAAGGDVTVVTAVRPRVIFSAEDQAGLRRDSLSGAQQGVKEELLLQKEDPGPTGGSMQCAVTGGDLQALCYASGAGYFVQIFVRGTQDKPLLVAQQALAAVVVKR